MLKTMRHTSSVNESVRVLAALRSGMDPVRLTRELAAQHPGDAGFASRLVDAASVRLWLDDGVPLADVLTMLEVRHRFELSPDLALTYAIEILWTVRSHNLNDSIHSTQPAKEAHYAAA